MRFYVIWVLFQALAADTALSAQSPILYTHAFQRLLNDYPLDFEKPKGWFKVFPLDKDAFFEYSLVLRSEDENIELRYIYEPAQPLISPYPQFKMSKTITEIASQEDKHLLFSRTITKQDIEQLYYAEWAGLITFRPKETFASFERGKLLLLFHPEKGYIYTIVLYNGSSELAEPLLSALRFKPDKKSG